jgi:hypothetical protein
MDVIRARFGSAVEWIVAAGFLMATLLVGSLIMRELRTAVPVATPAAAAGRSPAVLPAGIPMRAISVPVLLLLDGKEVRVGDSVDHIADLLGRSAEVGTQVVERGPIGERLTRFYEHAGTRFVLVFEPFEANGAMRVAGIYIQ